MGQLLSVVASWSCFNAIATIFLILRPWVSYKVTVRAFWSPELPELHRPLFLRRLFSSNCPCPTTFIWMSVCLIILQWVLSLFLCELPYNLPSPGDGLGFEHSWEASRADRLRTMSQKHRPDNRRRKYGAHQRRPLTGCIPTHWGSSIQASTSVIEFMRSAVVAKSVWRSCPPMCFDQVENLSISSSFLPH